jgi:AAA domain
MKEIFREWLIALKEEINYIKTIGGKGIDVENGRCIHQEVEHATYSFTCPNGAMLLEGAPVRLVIGELSCYGTVLSFLEREVILQLNGYVGEEVAEAELIAEPWELLEKLRQRIKEIPSSKKKLRRVKNILFPPSLDRTPNKTFKHHIHEIAVRSKYNPVTFIWGPPGTGKTYALARIALQKYMKNQSVLILAHSNQAVDVIIEEISRLTKKYRGYEEGHLLRYGVVGQKLRQTNPAISVDHLVRQAYPDWVTKKEALTEERAKLMVQMTKGLASVNDLKRLDKQLLQLRDQWKKEEEKVMEEAKIIGTTLSKAAVDPMIYNRTYDIVLVDEASMAYVPQIAFASSLGKRIIVCGDFRQLPPIALSNHPLVEKWLKEDIFYHSGVVNVVDQGKSHPHLYMLTVQRRMHPDISAFTNHYMYGGQVTDDPSIGAKRGEITEKAPFPKSSFCLVDHSDMGIWGGRHKASRYHLLSALLSLTWIEQAKKNHTSIGYVSPYRAQTKLVSSFLEEQEEQGNLHVLAATVHKYQGSERDVLFFDTVDGEGHGYISRMLTGSKSDRLINVALTRSRGKCILMSDIKFLEKASRSQPILQSLMSYGKTKTWVQVRKQLSSMSQLSTEKLQWWGKEGKSRFLHELCTAQSVVLSIGKGESFPMDFIQYIQEKNDRVNWTIVAQEQLSDRHPRFEWILTEHPLSYVIIDEETLWIGNPRFSDGPFYVRVCSRKFCETLLSFVK